MCIYRNLNILTTLGLFVVLLLSCKKNNLAVGEYALAVNITVPLLSGDSTTLSESTTVRIVESNKSEAELLSGGFLSILQINKRIISGSCKIELSAPQGVTRRYDPMNINGVIEKECGKYYISGDFDAVYKWTAVNSTGDFSSDSTTVSGKISIFPKN